MKGSGGFGLVNLFVFMGVFLFFLLVVSFLVHHVGLDDGNSPLLRTDYTTDKQTNYNNTNVQNATYDYTIIEKQLKTAAALYQKDLYPDFNDKNDVMYVTSKKLIALDYLANLTDGKVSCDGYAKFTYNNVVQITPYIKCGDMYKTKGYEASHAK